MTDSNSTADITGQAPAVVNIPSLRKCLGRFGTGVAVVAAQSEGKRYGMTINSFSALSLSPPLVIWSIRNESSALDFFKNAKNFAINILAFDQISVSAQFTRSDTDPFEKVQWTSGESGEPILSDISASLCCSHYQNIPGGDHTIIVGQVESFSYSEKMPLLYVQGEYRVSAPHPQSSAMSGGQNESQGSTDASIMRLLSTVASQWIDEFDIERAAENLSRSQSRVLAWLSEGPLSLDELHLRTGLSDIDLDEDVMYLKAIGYVNRLEGSKFSLTQAGKSKRNSIAARVRDFEESKCSMFDPNDIRQFKLILSKMIATKGKT